LSKLGLWRFKGDSSGVKAKAKRDGARGQNISAGRAKAALLIIAVASKKLETSTGACL